MIGEIKMEGLTLYIIIGIIALVIIYVLLTLNKLIKLNNKVKEAFATMDVYLKNFICFSKFF